MNTFRKHFLSLMIVLSVATMLYLLIVRYVPLSNVSPVDTEKRISSMIESFQSGAYEARISEIINDKRTVYLLISVSTVLFVLLIILTVRVLSGVDVSFLLNPTKYSVLKKEDVSLCERLKWQEEQRQAGSIHKNKPNQKG